MSPASPSLTGRVQNRAVQRASLELRSWRRRRLTGDTRAPPLAPRPSDITIRRPGTLAIYERRGLSSREGGRSPTIQGSRGTPPDSPYSRRLSVDFKQFLHVLRRRWITIVVLVAVALGVAGVINWQTTPQYESKARIFIGLNIQSASDASGTLLLATYRAQSYADLADSTDLMNQVIERSRPPGHAERARRPDRGGGRPGHHADRPDRARRRPEAGPGDRPRPLAAAHRVPLRPGDPERLRHTPRSSPRSPTRPPTTPLRSHRAPG